MTDEIADYNFASLFREFEGELWVKVSDALAHERQAVEDAQMDDQERESVWENVCFIREQEARARAIRECHKHTD